MEIIGALSLPFLAICVVVYTAVMGWLIFRRPRLPDRLETATRQVMARHPVRPGRAVPKGAMTSRRR